MEDLKIMNIDNFKKDIQGLLAEVIESFDILKLATIYQNQSITQPPDLLKFYAQSREDIDIQYFNILSEIPSSFTTADEVALWILQTETLDREIVCNYLCSSHSTETPAVNPSEVLEKVSQSICLLDVSSSFLEGLRVFLSIVGYVRPENFSTDAQLKKLLQAYCKAHIHYSKFQLIQISNGSNHSVSNLRQLLYDVSLCIVNLYQTLSESNKSINLIKADFFKNIDISMKTYSIEIPSTLLNDIFESMSSGSKLIPLLSNDSPSYLFASTIKSGWMRLGFDTDGEVMMKSWIRLTHDALYIFVDEKATFVQGCIPLEFIRPRISDNKANYFTIELFPKHDKVLPYIAMGYDPDTRSSFPEEVTYHAMLVLEVCKLEADEADEETSHQTIGFSSPVSIPPVVSPASRAGFRAHVELVGQWLDSLEITSWKSRRQHPFVDVPQEDKGTI